MEMEKHMSKYMYYNFIRSARIFVPILPVPNNNNNNRSVSLVEIKFLIIFYLYGRNALQRAT